MRKYEARTQGGRCARHVSGGAGAATAAVLSSLRAWVALFAERNCYVSLKLSEICCRLCRTFCVRERRRATVAALAVPFNIHGAAHRGDRCR